MIFSYFSDTWHLALQGDLQGIYFYGSLYLLLVGSYSGIYRIKIRRWPSTKGHLIDSNVKGGVIDSGSSDQSFTVDVLYEYTVSGTKYRGNRLSDLIIMVSYNLRFLLKKRLAGIMKNDDGSVVVFYNPKNPKKSFLIKPSFLFLIFTWALAILPIFYYWMEYHG